MDFGLMGMEEGQHQQGGSPEPSSKRKFSGSGFLNQEGSVEDDQSRASKMAANAPDLGLLKQMPLLRSTSSCVGGPPQSQMLSFSSPTSGGGGGGGGGGGKSTAPVHPRNAGYASGSIHGSFTGIRGPFTPAQWIELEHQALIYKYFTANVPVPATLLFPIRKALISSGFPGFSTHSYGWGSFHLGYSCSSTDPEPGRCRRTDGKKWRCSRDAVPDQKYCERHINRGRHRSRKPVEGQTGHQAISRPTNPKVVPTSSSATSSGSSSNSLAIAAHQLTNLQVSAPSLATDSVVNRLQDSQGFSMMPTKASPFPIPKQHVPYEEPPRSEFGFVSSESLLNPSPRANMNCQTYNSFLSFNDQHTQDQHQIHPLVDESNHSTIPWPNELKSDWTQLSMSIPMSELSSSSNQEKSVASPLWLSREPDHTQTELGVRTTLNEAGSNWAPMSWGKPMGGPLGEVLNNADSSLNPMTDGYEGSPQFGSSPTGVLQKGASVSLSNSASGSSPRGESRMAHEGDCLGDDEMLGSAHATSPSIPAP